MPLFLSALFVVSLFVGGGNESSSELKGISGPAYGKSLDVYYFYGDGCPHCARVEPFLVEMEQKYNLALHRFDIYNNRSAIALFDEYSAEHGLTLETRGVPAVFVSDFHFVGDAPILEGFEETVEKALKEGTLVTVSDADLPVDSCQTDVYAVAGPSIWAVTVAALVDSISPCSIAILVFLIGARVLGADHRKRALKVGLSFCLAVFLAYFLFGLGVLSIVQQAGFSGTFSLLAGLIAILAGIFYFKDVFWYGKGGFVMEVPRSLKPLLTRLLKGVTSPVGAFAVGFAAACFELPCTGGPYLFILGQLANTATRLQTIPLLAYYSLIFVLPLLLISLLIYSNLFSTRKVREWSSRSKRSMKLLGGLTMVTMGFFTIPISQMLQSLQMFLQSFKAIGPPMLIIMSLCSFASLVKQKDFRRKLMRLVRPHTLEFKQRRALPVLLTLLLVSLIFANSSIFPARAIVINSKLETNPGTGVYEPLFGSGLWSTVSGMEDYIDSVHSYVRAAAVYYGDGIEPMAVAETYHNLLGFDFVGIDLSAASDATVSDMRYTIARKDDPSISDRVPIKIDYRMSVSASNPTYYLDGELRETGSYAHAAIWLKYKQDGQYDYGQYVRCIHDDRGLNCKFTDYEAHIYDIPASPEGTLSFEVETPNTIFITVHASTRVTVVRKGEEALSGTGHSQALGDPFMYVDPEFARVDEFQLLITNGWPSTGLVEPLRTPIDYDGDSFFTDVDCDDDNSAINPDAVEINDDGLDNDCDGTVDEAFIDGDDYYVNSSTTLGPVWHNIEDTSDRGVIIVNASNIELDCNGLTLNGTGSGTGIYNPGFDNVTIRNCNVHNYNVGILLASSENNTVIGNAISDNNIGIAFNRTEKGKIYNNFFSNLQTNVWEIENTRINKTFGGSDLDLVGSMIQTDDGGYAIAGTTYSYGPSGDFWLVKTDASGTMEWNKTYGGTSNDHAYSVVQTEPDGGYAIVGATNSYGVASDFWLVKTDASGNEEWNKTYGGASFDAAYSVVQTEPDGGYAIAGGTWSFGAGEFDFWLVKTDSAGNHLWNKTYGGTAYDAALSVVQTGPEPDGGYAIAGTTYSYGAGYQDFWLVKTDSAGNHLWNKTFGGTGWDEAWGLVETVDGGYAIAGSTWSFGAGEYDFWLVKTDADGNHVWNKTYGGSLTDVALSMVQTDDHGYAMAGVTYLYDVSGDFWLVKTDASGTMEWNQTYEGTFTDCAYSVVQTKPDRGYVMAGTTTSYGAGYEDVWLIKTDSLGRMPFTSDWNTTRLLSPNIVGKPYLGGNYWSDYSGVDNDGDGLGDTGLPYNSGGNITLGGDWLPLTLTSKFSNSTLGTDVTVKASTPIFIRIENVSDPNFEIGGTEGSIGIFLNITANAPFEWAYITVQYDESKLTVEESTLRMHYWNATLNDWSLVPNSGVNTTADYVWANVTHFTIFTGIEDTSHPLMTLTSPANTTYTTRAVPLEFTVNEPTSWIGYSLDNNPNVTITGNTTLIILTDGSHSIILYANDTVGNMGVSEIALFTVDAPPRITLSSPEYPYYYYKTYIPLIFDLSEPVSWIGYSLNGEANVTILGPVNLTEIDDGLHIISVYANGTDGGMGSSSQVFFFYCLGDMTGPTQWVPDWKVDIRDVSMVAIRFGANYGDPKYDARADMNDDGKIDIKDIATVAKEFGKVF